MGRPQACSLKRATSVGILIVPQHKGQVDAVAGRCAAPEAASQGVAPTAEHPRIRLSDCTTQAVAVALAPGVSPAVVYRAPGEVIPTASLGQGDIGNVD